MSKIKKAVKKKVAEAGAGLRRAAGGARQAVKQFTAWSYSRYKDHRECPRAAHWKHILKKPQGPKSPAMERGGTIHKEGEHYLLGKTDKGKKISPDAVPASFNAFRKEMKELRKAKAIAEGKWALTVKWTITDFFDWAHAWCRLVLDAHYMPSRKIARVIDFKTGKIYLDDNLEQVELYAVGAFSNYPEAEEAQVELWYLDQPRVPPGKPGENPLVRTYSRKQGEALRKTWGKKVVPLLMDKRFVPNPSGWRCGRCDFSKRKGGECQY